MEKVSLSMLVVNCKDYQPSSNWYFQKSERCICGTWKNSNSKAYNERKLEKYESSDDYVLMPECSEMSDEEASEVVKLWCEKNGIPYIDDLEDIDIAYKWYYKYPEFEDPRNAPSNAIYHWVEYNDGVI